MTKLILFACLFLSTTAMADVVTYCVCRPDPTGQTWDLMLTVADAGNGEELFTKALDAWPYSSPGEIACEQAQQKAGYCVGSR